MKKFNYIKWVTENKYGSLKEQDHWYGPPIPPADYNPPVDDNGQIIPGAFICLNNNCEDCAQGQPVSYQCYNPDPAGPLYDSLGDCQSNCGSTNLGCDSWSDFDYDTSNCTLHLNPGQKNSWAVWLNRQYNFFTGEGCNHLADIVSYFTNHITPTTNCPAIHQEYGGERLNGTCNSILQVKRSIAKINWAQCMQQQCVGGSQKGC